jgi:glycosyltransferase involved in cell wall biosynthesis
MKLSTPLVSVYIPAYNAGLFLNRSISSVLNQTFDDYHLYVIDDASTDNTAEVVEPFLDHPKVTYLRNSSNLGMSQNWNKGLELATGKYVAKLDADDFYKPYFLEETIAVLEQNPQVGLVFGGYEWITHEGSQRHEEMFYSESWVEDGAIFIENLQRRFVSLGPTICVRRECYDRLGHFVGEMRIHTDWEMWMRIATDYSVAYINKVLASIYRHSNSVTAGSQSDTRTPDDFTIWLNLLDQKKLNYELSPEQRNLLELSMIKKCRDLLYRAIRNEAWITMDASLRFLLQRKQVPFYEKVRYLLLLSIYKRYKRAIPQVMRGSKVTTNLWNLESKLAIKLPARNPYSALELTKAQHSPNR